jgi:hypothetical protein
MSEKTKARTKADLFEMLAQAVRNTLPQPVQNTQPEPVRDGPLSRRATRNAAKRGQRRREQPKLREFEVLPAASSGVDNTAVGCPHSQRGASVKAATGRE